MSFVEVRKKHTKWNIEQNPTEVTVKRTERVKKQGYYDQVESMVGPFIVRIFVANGATQTISTLAGEKQVDRYFGLLADFEADIRSGTHVTDEFEALGMKFVVKAVYPQYVQGKVVGYQGELERVM